MQKPTARSQLSTREKRRLRVRATILDEALALMGETGPEGIGVRELARRMNYSPGALYRYFEDREQIVSTLTADAMAMLRDRLGATPEEDGVDHLIAVGEAYLDFAHAEPVRFRLLFAEQVSERTTLQSGPKPESPYSLVLDIARTAITQGRISTELDAEIVAFTLWALVHGMAVLESTHLREFRADFAKAHRLALRQLVNSWRPSGQQGRQA
jgi:AcrR family transcriptional regulator